MAGPEGRSLRIYTTTIPTEHRLYTLMHDPQYLLAIAWQNVVYNRPLHPGPFFRRRDGWFTVAQYPARWCGRSNCRCQEEVTSPANSPIKRRPIRPFYLANPTT